MSQYLAEGKCLRLYLVRKTNNGKVFLGESLKHISEAFSQLVHRNRAKENNVFKNKERERKIYDLLETK